MEANNSKTEEFDLKSLKNTKRQHYVPQFYLDYWVVPHGVDVKSKIEGSKPEYPQYYSVGIGMERYFYEIEMDDTVWNMLNYRYGEEAKTDQFIKKILDELHLLKRFDDIGSKGIGIVNPDEVALKNLQGILLHLKKHHLEDAYGRIERVISSEINRFVDSQDSDTFVPPTQFTFENVLMFYGLQRLRTRERIDSINSEISEMILSRGDCETVLTDIQKQSVMKCILYISSLQFCKVLEKAECTMNILKNKTDLDYITSDCPAMYFERGTYSMEYAVGMLPLSPKLLVVFKIPDLEKKGNREMGYDFISDEKHVRGTNVLIERNSYNFVYTKIRK